MLGGSAVIGVIAFVTSDLSVTFLVFLCVLHTNACLFGLIHFWGLTLNPLVVVNIVVAIGVSVDYSAHIAYAFLTTPVPEKDGNESINKNEIRHHKATIALNKMGSSVFHGGFSTFLAILVLAGVKSYIFAVFFRIWLGIVVFGMGNGFLFLPIMLSLIGPTHTSTDPSSLIESSPTQQKVVPIEETQPEDQDND